MNPLDLEIYRYDIKMDLFEWVKLSEIFNRDVTNSVLSQFIWDIFVNDGLVRGDYVFGTHCEQVMRRVQNLEEEK